jgi:hypothetical protein
MTAWSIETLALWTIFFEIAAWVLAAGAAIATNVPEVKCGWGQACFTEIFRI